jgi:Zn-dependent metalloprotease
MKRLFCIIADSLLIALSFLSPVLGQEYIRVADRDKRGNDVVVYRDAVTGVAKRAWHQQRLVLSAFDSSLATPEGSFIGMRAVNEARIERIIPKVLRYYDRVLKIDPAEFVKRQIETDGDKWYVTFKQVHKGVPVYRAEVGLTIDEFGQIISIGANSIPNVTVSTTPSISEAEAISVALREMTTFADDSLSIRSKPELVIYPKRSATEVKSYLAYQVDAMNHTHHTGERIFVDAHSGMIIEKASLFKHGNKTIQGNISGRYWPKDLNSTQATDFPKYYQQLKVTNNLGQTVVTGYIDANGNYSLTWNGAVGTYRLQIALKGSYAEVTNVPNTTLSFVVSGTTTYNRQFSADQEAYNLYFHMNKVHDWFKATPFNYNGMDYRMKGTAYAGSGVNGQADGTDIFFGTQNGNLWHSQSDGIYHEYTHNVVNHIYGNWIDPGTQGNTQGDAMDEALPDYFACSLADDPCGGHWWEGTSQHRIDVTLKILIFKLHLDI